MLQLLGEYECKIDSKGRLRLPSQLLRQLGQEGLNAFVVNRGLEKCINLYPRSVWKETLRRIESLNDYNSEHRQFLRLFYRGATDAPIDGADRILLSKRLIDYAGIEKDLVLAAMGDRVEIWDKAAYEQMLKEDDNIDFAALANRVLGGNPTALPASPGSSASDNTGE